MKTANKIYSNFQEFKTTLDNWRHNNESIVFTNGCFDLVHLGHVDYLEKARNLGSKLIVGLNTDLSVSSNKGENRPITDQISRSRVLASMAFVDAVILFDSETPLDLICQIVPNILVKGNDYTIKTIVGADFVIEKGGKVETIELVQGYSTTKIINKIINIK